MQEKKGAKAQRHKGERKNTIEKIKVVYRSDGLLGAWNDGILE
jgi:hypothetical protein